MNITKSDTIDTNSILNSNSAKILMMDSLIEHFSPLFYEDLRKKQGQIKSNESDIEKLKQILIKDKEILAKLKVRIEIENLKNKILKEINYLNTIDVIYGKNKITIQSIVSSLDKQNVTSLKKRLALLQKLVNQKKGVT